MNDSQSLLQRLYLFWKSMFLPVDIRSWIVPTIYAIILFIGASGYYWYTRHSYTLETVNVVLADVALLLIGYSFILSSICYLWDFADSQMKHRKHLGLAGFAVAMTHFILALWVYPTYFTYDKLINPHDDFFLPFIYGLISLVIYGLMAAISNQFAAHELGGLLWKKVLRFGYIAYVFTLLHFAVYSYPLWLRWFEKFSTTRLPPFNLIVFLFGLSVIIMRIVLWFLLSLKKTSSVS